MEVGVIAIVGPTASGKTAAALAVAQRYNGEIVSADSMQIYRGMDIGTAKATPQERALVPHHMLDVAEPDQPYTTAQYAQGAGAAIADILARGKLPILCGGTGLYLEAALYEMEMGVAPDPAFRQRMEALGNAQLHDRLVQVDPISAARIHPNDRKRVIRALEIQAQTGRPASTQGQGFRQGRQPRYRFLELALELPREALYERIDRRVDQMLQQGLLDEVRRFQPYDRSLPALQGIGYKEMLAHLDGRCTLAEAVAAVKQASRRYAKRQLTWFRRDPAVEWTDDMNTVHKKIVAFLE